MALVAAVGAAVQPTVVGAKPLNVKLPTLCDLRKEWGIEEYTIILKVPVKNSSLPMLIRQLVQGSSGMKTGSRTAGVLPGIDFCTALHLEAVVGKVNNTLF